jgi:hypothetical protein
MMISTTVTNHFLQRVGLSKSQFDVKVEACVHSLAWVELVTCWVDDAACNHHSLTLQRDLHPVVEVRHGPRPQLRDMFGAH